MSQRFYYAVKVGNQPGIYTTWDECKEQINGIKDAKFMKFKTIASAEAFINGSISLDDYQLSKEFISSIKHGGLIPDYKYPSEHWNQYNGEFYIFTDGSKKGSTYRFAIYFGKYSMNIVQELSETTNNRCELLAILKSLELILHNASSIKHTKVNIISDSEYTVKSCNMWISLWEERNWLTSTGSEVANKDIMQALSHMLEKVKHNNLNVDIMHMNSHENPPLDDERAMFMWRGNKVVDLLAQGMI
jgi:ribonuclease HI